MNEPVTSDGRLTFDELLSHLEAIITTATTQGEMTRITRDLPRIWSANS